MRPYLKAGAEYFAAVFAAGLLLGTVRTVAVTPRIGELSTVVAEIPLMLLFAWAACKFVMGRYPQTTAAGSALAPSGYALLLLLNAETVLPAGLAGRPLDRHVSLYRKRPTKIGLIGQILFALFPYLRARARAEETMRPPGKTGNPL